ncbi:MAG: pyruvate ferredoxin oxidoreductase [Dehalococcoidia bacterium]|jgi:pyruvate ferredoxin oxidoreductase beta subunit|nr:pyruvate ferredoxin oxidoreductase [Chloroflexota bacterium]MCK4242949.1 pyruvate ferredoxin oxidoreductase [Dehalococcoidia bacterium]
MAVKLTEICNQEDGLAPGHRACIGCGETIIARQILQAIDSPVVAASSTGCLEIVTSPYPFTSWRIPWIHNAFENVATTLAAAETAYRVLIKQGKIEDRGIKFVAFGGDGATYDIGLQFISGVIDRGHRLLYVCLNNEAYMNTGIQRSGATPMGAWTTTTPVGRVVPGKRENRKDITAIMVAHDIPYAAQVAPHAWRDLMTKVQKAVAIDGPSFINALCPCPRGWRYDTDKTIALSKLAAETCVWPLYEVIDGEWKLNFRPSPKRPITDWFQSQGRFAHLLRPENKHLVDEIQEVVDREWERLLERCKVAG